MTWAQPAIDLLTKGHRATIQVFGNSMRPRILSGSTVTIAPLGAYAVGDVVLVNVGDHVTLHGIRDAGAEAHSGVPLVLIGDERGNVDGWFPVSAIYGVVVDVVPPCK